MKQKINLIVAYSQENRAIGKNNQLLWHLPEDLKNFKKLTKGGVVIMGRKTYESIPSKFRPLPGRENLVLTRDSKWGKDNDIQTFSSIESAILAALKTKQEIYIIGGSSIYVQALEKNLVDRLHLSLVEENYPEADVFFPEIDFKKWKLIDTQDFKGFQYQLWDKV